PVLLKSSSRTTKLWSFSADVGSASPKESRFDRSFHTSSVMCFEVGIVRVFGQEENEEETFAKHNDSYFDASWKAEFL
ncbi:hypothetical protein J7T56_02260, partial [Lactobacillus delbrueckii subsp. lactis]